MNRLIILGNGFDLAHKLKTSYSDFILDLVKSELVESFQKCTFDFFSEETNYSNSIFKIHRKGNLRIDQKVIVEVQGIETFEKLKQFLTAFHITVTANSSKSIFQKTFSSLTSTDINWADVEATYYDTLLEIIERNPTRKLHPNRKSEVIHLNKELDVFREKLIEYLTKIESEGEIAKEVSGSRFWGKLKGRRNGLYPNGIHILNFNFTQTIAHYGDHSQDNSIIEVEINNIHGQLKDPASIIFGYGDETDSFYKKLEDLDVNELLSHAKSFGYFKNSNYKNLLSFINAGSFETWIVGHSCGLSDRVMLKKILEHKNCEHISAFHYFNQDSHDHTEKTQQISRHFEDKELMRERITCFDPNDSIKDLIG